MRRILVPALCCFPALAQATTLNVTGPDVTADKGVLEYRSGIDFADEENRQSVNQYLHADYGLNDTVALRASGTGRKRGAEDLEYNATGFEARFQLFEREQAGFAGSLRLNYQLADGDDKPDAAGIAWLAEHRLGAFTLIYNAALSHQAGEDADGGLLGDLRWQATAPLPESGLKLGLEGFHNLGRLGDMAGFDTQQHRIGPVLKGKFTDRVGFQIGYLQGISAAAPDQAVKFFVNVEF